MKITKHGAERNRGYKSVWLDKPTIAWDVQRQRVTISQTPLPEFVPDGQPYASEDRPPPHLPLRAALADPRRRFKYTVSLSLDEVRAVLDVCISVLKNKSGRAV